MKYFYKNYLRDDFSRAFSYLPLLSLDTTQVDLPQNGVKSHDLPGSTVAHRVDAKHIPGKSINRFHWKPEKPQLMIFIHVFNVINVDVNQFQISAGASISVWAT